MTQADDRILETLQDVEMALSPRVIAFNIDYTRNYVNRRMTHLREAELVDRVDEGMYRISDKGRAYLSGDLDADALEDVLDDP